MNPQPEHDIVIAPTQGIGQHAARQHGVHPRHVHSSAGSGHSLRGLSSKRILVINKHQASPAVLDYLALIEATGSTITYV